MNDNKMLLHVTRNVISLHWIINENSSAVPWNDIFKNYIINMRFVCHLYVQLSRTGPYTISG